MYGYDGASGQRVTALFQGRKKTLFWGDGISEEELEPFASHPDYADVRIEDVADKAAERRAHPRYAGRA